MILLPQQDAVFVGIPRAASRSMSEFLERAFRDPSQASLEVESLHSWHASIEEASYVCDFPLRTMWSFCIVRNPFDRIVSWCAMSDPTFETDPMSSVRNMLLSEEDRWTLPQNHFTKDVKTIFRFEALEEAVVAVREKLAIPSSVAFPHEHESAHQHYRAYFDPASRTMAEIRYAEDLHTFDYSF